jgi:glutamate racemase
MPHPHPLGFFDSGLGGLSIWRAVSRHLPDEHTLYVADRAYCPYGARAVGEVIQRARTITGFLQDRGCKLIVVACNTASAAALKTLRAEFQIPIVGLEPAIKPAAQATRTGQVGVLATAGTIQGYLFRHTSQRHANGVQVHVQIGEGLVEQIEAGHFDTPTTEGLLRQYLNPMLAAGVDQIVLGCTHYPLLMPLIQRIIKGQAAVIDPAQAVAYQVERLLISKDILRTPNLDKSNHRFPEYRFYTTGRPRMFQFPGPLANPAGEQSILFESITLADCYLP